MEMKLKGFSESKRGNARINMYTGMGHSKFIAKSGYVVLFSFYVCRLGSVHWTVDFYQLFLFAIDSINIEEAIFIFG